MNTEERQRSIEVLGLAHKAERAWDLCAIKSRWGFIHHFFGKNNFTEQDKYGKMKYTELPEYMQMILIAMVKLNKPSKTTLDDMIYPQLPPIHTAQDKKEAKELIEMSQKIWGEWSLKDRQAFIDEIKNFVNHDKCSAHWDYVPFEIKDRLINYIDKSIEAGVEHSPNYFKQYPAYGAPIKQPEFTEHLKKAKSCTAECDIVIHSAGTKIRLLLYEDNSVSFNCDNLNKENRKEIVRVFTAIQDILEEEYSPAFTPHTQEHKTEEKITPKPPFDYSLDEVKRMWMSHNHFVRTTTGMIEARIQGYGIITIFNSPISIFLNTKDIKSIKWDLTTEDYFKLLEYARKWHPYT